MPGDRTKICDLEQGGACWREMDGSITMEHYSGYTVTLDRRTIEVVAREWMNQNGIKWHAATIKVAE